MVVETWSIQKWKENEQSKLNTLMVLASALQLPLLAAGTNNDNNNHKILMT